MSPWRVVRRLLSEAALRPARWRASSCRPKLGGALKTSHPPPRQRPSAAPCWPIRRRSWSREHRASCGSRMRGPSGPRARASASSAALRSTRRASATFKRGAPQGPSSRPSRWLFFLRGRLPLTVVNWGSIYLSIIYLSICTCTCACFVRGECTDRAAGGTRVVIVGVFLALGRLHAGSRRGHCVGGE